MDDFDSFVLFFSQTTLEISMKETPPEGAIAPISSSKPTRRRRSDKTPIAPQYDRDQLNAEAQQAAQHPIGRSVSEAQSVQEALIGARNEFVSGASDELAIAFDTMSADTLFATADKLLQMQEGRANMPEPFQQLVANIASLSRPVASAEIEG